MNSPIQGHANRLTIRNGRAAWPSGSEPRPLQLARFLHDDLCQLLSLGLVHLAHARRELPEAETLHKAELRILDALQACRRLIEQVCEPSAMPAPTVAGFAELAAGLHRSVQALADQHQQQLGFSALGHTEQIPPGTVQALLAASQGLLINACQHGQPSSARLRLVGGHRQLRISISNSTTAGTGLVDQPDTVSGGRGLSLVREQLSAIDAQLLWRRHRDRVQAAILWPARRSAA